jgi:hypothetical protein
MQQETKVKIKCIGILWSWWKARNKANTREETCNTQRVVAQVNRLAEEYEDLFVKNSVQKARTIVKWSVPEGDVLKINTNGCFDSRSEKGGWGFVVRDSTGEAVGVSSGRLDHVQDAFQSEAEAVSQALQIVQIWGISSIQLESDSQTLVQAINSNNGNWVRAVCSSRRLRNPFF